MDSRERMLITMAHGQADMVPVSPDISNMVPCKLQNRPFWEIYVNNNPPLWKAYIEAVEYFQMDGYYPEAGIDFISSTGVEYDRVYLIDRGDRYVERRLWRTPAGNMTETIVYPNDNPPTTVEKVIKDFLRDFEKYKYRYPRIEDYDDSVFKIQREELGDMGVIGSYAGDPGLATMLQFFQGGLETAVYAYHDHPDEFFEVVRQQHEWCVRKAELAIAAGVDFVEVGGAGDLSIQSPAMWRQMVLPTIEEITKMCHQAGVISSLHTCGKERYIVEACADETDLDCIEPLEPPPMGDCDLKQLKESFGDRLCLKGNLHTTEVMLFGSPADVEKAARQAIDDAGMNGAFILSTGDQCGRDTPEENILKMIEVARTYGRY